MHRIAKYEAMYNFEEQCPHCDNPIPILIDESDFVHYSIDCPFCGVHVLLCTLCQWDQELEDDFSGEYRCDWCENNGCFREKKGNK